MTERETELGLSSRDGIFASEQPSSIPIHLVRALTELPDLTDGQRRWLETCGFKARKKSHILLPAEDGSLAAVLYAVGDGDSGEPCGPADFLVGGLASKLPPGTYRFGHGVGQPTAAAIAWGLGSYAYRRFKSETEAAHRSLVIGAKEAGRIRTITDAVWLGRDLINAPAGDLGPAELEKVARFVAERRGADCHVITGEDLLAENFPMIHAVGRASTRAPRLIDIRWGRQDATKVTLVGKGICFDTGGLDLKPASAMLLMKKDMGGAASALALADMIMGLGVDVRLRLLLAVAENSVGGNAFRPGDVIPTRAGFNVEIGNTDAEGRLVLSDALALADEEQPDIVATFATLTGAARVALGPDLPAMFSTDDGLAHAIVESGTRAADPVWRMPFWAGYDRNLEHGVGDFNNISEGPFAGSITAALFLKRFVREAKRYVHFDLYGWRPAARPLGPKGGEPQVARAMLEAVEAFAGRQ